MGVNWLPEGVDPSEAVPHLKARLEVVRIRETHLLSIAMEDIDETLPAPLVNSVTASLLKEIKAFEKDKVETLISSLFDEKGTMEASLAFLLCMLLPALMILARALTMPFDHQLARLGICLGGVLLGTVFTQTTVFAGTQTEQVLFLIIGITVTMRMRLAQSA